MESASKPEETPKSVLLMSPEELQSLAESGQLPPELEALQTLKFSFGTPLGIEFLAFYFIYLMLFCRYSVSIFYQNALGHTAKRATSSLVRRNSRTQ